MTSLYGKKCVVKKGKRKTTKRSKKRARVTSQTQFKDRHIAFGVAKGPMKKILTFSHLPCKGLGLLIQASRTSLTCTPFLSINLLFPNLSHQWLHQAELHWKTFHLSIPTFRSDFVVLLISNIPD